MYSVYKHTNKANGKVYIGITKQDVERRWQNGHGYDGTYFGNAISKYGWNGFTHEVLFSGLSKRAACDMERFLIIYFQSNDRERGYNIAEGGQTGDNLHAMNGSDNPRAAQVRRINQKTGEVTVFQTINTAANSMGINYRGISKCCLGVCKTYKGYIWEYADKEYEKPVKPEMGKYPHTKIMKKIEMTDEHGNIFTFGSIKEAGEKLGLYPSTISRYLNGTRKDKDGWLWNFAR